MNDYDSRYLLESDVLVIRPLVAYALGLNEAVIVQQLRYWLERSVHRRKGRTWIYNTYEDWQKQFPFWSLSTVKRTIRRLEEKGVILSTDEYNLKPTDRTKWYALDGAKLDALVDEVAEEVKLTRSRAGQNDPLMEEVKLTRSDQRLHSEKTNRDGASAQEQFEELFVIES